MTEEDASEQHCKYYEGKKIRILKTLQNDNYT